MTPKYLNLPVDVQIQWPRKETTTKFGSWEIVAFPPTQQHNASLHIDLRRTGHSDVRGASVLCQFLSIAAWIDDTFAVLLPGGAGTVVPCRVSRQTESWPSSILDSWCNNWQPLGDAKARKALAIYREAVNMKHFHSLPYAVLGFYKICEAAYGSEVIAELAKHVSDQLACNWISIHELKQIGFDQHKSPEEIAKFLSKNGRHAVAHANHEPTINPDDFEQQRDMSVAASILQMSARACIKAKFKVGTNRWDQNDLH
jgi:hypothetical protein